MLNFVIILKKCLWSLQYSDLILIETGCLKQDSEWKSQMCISVYCTTVKSTDRPIWAISLTVQSFQQSVNSQWLRQWKGCIFDSPQNRCLLTYRPKIMQRWLLPRPIMLSKFGENLSMGAFLANRWNITVIFLIYTPFLRNSPTGQITHQIFTLDGLCDADSDKGVPFLAFVDTAAHLGGQIAPKPQFQPPGPW